MAKVVSQKREMPVRSQDGQAPAPAWVALIGLLLAGLCIVGAVAMVLLAFSVKPT